MTLEEKKKSSSRIHPTLGAGFQKMAIAAHLTTPIILNLPIALQLLWKGLFGRGSSMLAKKISHPVEPSTLKSRHRRDRHVRQVKYDTGCNQCRSHTRECRPPPVDAASSCPDDDILLLGIFTGNSTMTTNGRALARRKDSDREASPHAG